MTLTPRDGDLDLIAVGANAFGQCNTGVCRGASQGSTSPEMITIDPASRGESIYFIVDSFGGAASSFSISVSCTKKN